MKGIFLFLVLFPSLAFSQGIIYSGIPWFDEQGKVVSAHGGCVVKEKGRYYFFGERHSDTSNAFAGFNCYSSADLSQWKFERIALPVQDTGRMGVSYVGERPKVMRCPKTGEFILYFHADSLGYKSQYVGYATSKTITGPYHFQGAMLFNGKPIRKWDMGTFQDKDGTGYVLAHGGEIYKLSADYKSVTEVVTKSITSGFESPVLFRKDSLYYFLGSNLTSWECNDNYYFTASNLKGPWMARGLFAPEHSLTWNSQSTFVLPVEGSKGTIFICMGDRWSYPLQASAATYVWQPLLVSGTSLSIPDFQDAWQLNTKTGLSTTAMIGGNLLQNNDKRIRYQGMWTQISDGNLSVSRSDKTGDSISLSFTGRQVGFYSLARSDGGYGKVRIHNANGKEVLAAVVDFYSLYPAWGLRFLSPVLPAGDYTLTVSVMGWHSKWSDKRKTDYGSTGNFIYIQKMVIRP
jgi:hypothetical protein